MILRKYFRARQYHYAEKIIELISVGDSGHKSGVLSQIYE